MTHCGTFLVRRSADEVFDLVANPERFAPLLPNFESIAMLDATNFTLRVAISVGQISGHANLAMELREAARPSRVEYFGQGIVAGSTLSLGILFAIAPVAETTEVRWKGEIALEGMLALMAGDLIETQGHRNFELMAERLRSGLEPTADTGSAEPSASQSINGLDFEI